MASCNWQSKSASVEQGKTGEDKTEHPAIGGSKGAKIEQGKANAREEGQAAIERVKAQV